MKFFKKREVWRPTIFGHACILLIIAVIGSFLVFHLYPFLALNRPLPNPELIIVEGWLPESVIDTLCDETPKNVTFITTGGPIYFANAFLKGKTFAQVCAMSLQKKGIPRESIIEAPSSGIDTNLTYTSALAVREKLKQMGLFGKTANLYSMGAHSRRSYLMYRYAFGEDVPLGVISLESNEVDLRHWWSSSVAFKQILSESISWVFVQCTKRNYLEN